MSDRNALRVGFVGLGRMGRPMSHNLLRAGFPLTVCSRSRPPIDELAAAGAATALVPAQVAAVSDVVLTCLPTVEASEQVYLGPEGLVARGLAGQILVELSTIGPRTAKRIAAAAQARGQAFLDAPVSGGPEGARAATLTIMVGGDSAVLARSESVLRAVGRNIRLMGPVGAGSVAKLANQALVAIHAASAAEAMVLGTAAGSDPARLLDVLSTSFGQSRVLERSGPRFLTRRFDEAAPVRLLLKDLRLVRELGDELGVDLSMTRLAEQLCRRAEAMGLAEADFAALVLPLERQAGVEVRVTKSR